MLTPRSEVKTIRIGSANADGKEVLAQNASYGEQGITVSFDFTDREYCAGHSEEIKAAMTAFLTHLNELLLDEALPQIETAND